MPELPEVETTLRGVSPYLADGFIEKVTVYQSQLRWPVPAKLARIKNLQIENLARRGKYILVSTDRGAIIIHLGMSGSLRIVDTPLEKRKHDHVVFQLRQNKLMVYHDPRRFGTVLWTTEPPELHPLLASLGPEPLSNEFDGALLFRCLLYTSPSPRDATLSRMPSSA